MSYDLPGQGTSQMMPSQMRQALNPIQYAICTKHEQAIDTFCMSHNKALCPQCIPEHQKNMMYFPGVGNAPSDGRHPPGQQGQCNLKYHDQAIKESITRMHVSLRSVQEFIKKKESIDQIENPGMRQIYLEQNHIFETSYNVAHDLLTRIQSMTLAEKVISLEPFNNRFQEKFAQLQNTSQYMEQIIQQMQNHQIGGQNRQALEGMPAASASYFPQSTDMNYMGQQSQEQMMRHHPATTMHPPQGQDYLYYQQKQQLQDAHQQQVGSNLQMQQQPIYHQQQSAARPPQSGTPAHAPESQQQTSATSQPSQPAAAFNGQNGKYGQVTPQMQGGLPVLAQGNAHHKLPAQGQFAHGFSQPNAQKAAQQPADVESGSDLAHVNKQRKIAEQTRQSQGMELEQSTQYPANLPAASYGQGIRPRPSAPKQPFPTSQQPPFVPGYKHKHHKGIQLFVTVEIEDQYLTQMNPPNQHSNSDPKFPSAKQIEFEIELDPNWTLKEFSQKVKEDIMRSQLAVKDQSVIDRLLFYNADRVGGANGQSAVHNFFNELTNQNMPLGKQNIQSGSQIIVTTIQKVNPPSIFPPTGRPGGPRPGGGFYGADGQRAGGPYNQMGSPTNGPLPNKPTDGIANGSGFTPPPLKNPPTQRQPAVQNPDSMTKKVIGKTSGVRPPKELDANGLPVKKPRQKRAPKPVEEIELQFRVKTQAEKAQEEQYDAGFAPTPPVSDHEGDGEDNPEEEKQDADAQNEEEKNETKQKPAAGDDKAFDHIVKVQPKMKLKGIRKAILEELGVQDMCTARIFSIDKLNVTDAPKSGEDEKEEDEEPAEELEKETGFEKADDGPEELMGEMASIETLGLQNGGRLEVEVYFNLEVSVQGKGAGYTNKIEVGPEESMDVIESRVSFFRMFQARNFQIYDPQMDRVIEGGTLGSTLFRDSQLKNGSKLVLREPVKKKIDADGEPMESEEEDEGEEGEAEMLEEGGEDEIYDMNEEGEAEMDEDAPAGDEPAEVEDQAEEDAAAKDEQEGDAAGNNTQEKLDAVTAPEHDNLISNNPGNAGVEAAADASQNQESRLAAEAGNQEKKTTE